jgi:hypothetical protein
METNIILEILKLTIPAFIVFLTVYFMLQHQFKRDLEIKILELKMKDSKELKILRLQAYERLSLFLERIAPYNIITRTLEPEMLGQELQYAIIRTIRAEFDHNLSQQIYVSANAWSMISQSKDEIIKTIGMISAQVPNEVSAHELSRIIIDAIANANVPLPTQQALDFLKAEARELF